MSIEIHEREVIMRIKKEMEVMLIVKRQKLQYLWHVLRGEK